MTTIKQGDDGRRLQLWVTDRRNEPVDITGASVLLSASRLGAPTVTLPAVVVDGPAGLAEATVTAAAFTPGEYRALAHVTLPDGERFFSPTEGALCLTVEAAPEIGALP